MISSPIRCNKLIAEYQATCHQLRASRPTLLVICQQKQTHLESRVFHYTRACVRVFKHLFCQQHISSGVFHSLMAVPTKDDFERCNELRQWCMNHSGQRPHRRYSQDDKTGSSLAKWLGRALARRTSAVSDRPSGRQLTATETAHLNNILASRRHRLSTAEPVPDVAAKRSSGATATDLKDDFERCNELRQWCLNHSGERPRRRSDDQTETSLAMWLDKALSRRARAHNNRPSGRQLTATETAHLNSILTRPQVVQVAATASATSSGATATELNAAPEGAEPPEPSTSKRLRQNSSASIRFIAAVQRMKRRQIHFRHLEMMGSPMELI